ncbi:MAG: Arc family DNA binding domain-containing protein [Hyphomonadaceae bacterium]|nr:Arc family DNA binding domain-containing protein [Hyphomonadaceae bacterium]
MATDRKAFALRLDPTLHDAIARLAGAELRSINAEIEFLLREALRARGIKLSDKAVAEDKKEPGGE